jgi:hypothetical protein
MKTNVEPIYAKVEILLKKRVNNVQLPSLTKLEFLDASLVITGDYLVITTKRYGETLEHVNKVGEIFHLSEISAYKTYSKLQ